jgi:ornithine cyclodeaminase
MSTAMQIIDERAIRASVREPEALAAAERAFRALGEGRVELPPPIGFGVPEVGIGVGSGGGGGGEVHVKAAYLRGAPVFSVKVATGFYRNVERGLPSGSGMMLVFDAASGFPLAVLADNGYLTDLRTAAAGALAARLLAPPALGVVGVLGSGVQARYQLRALAGVRRWERTVAWSPTRAHLERYCREMEAEFQLPFEAAASADAAVRGAELVITATPSRAPLFDASSLLAHATVIAVGADGPAKRELPTTALARADKLVVDRLSQCLELGELHHAVAEGALRAESIYAELGAIVVGARPGREADELIVCDLTGVGAQDAAIAEAAWQRLSAQAGDDGPRSASRA